MQSIPCIVTQWIPIICSGVHAARPNASQLNAVDYMRHGPKHPDSPQLIPCSVIEYRGFHSLWLNGSRVYAVESMERDCMHCIPFSVKKWNPIECNVSGGHQWHSMEDGITLVCPKGTRRFAYSLGGSLRRDSDAFICTRDGRSGTSNSSFWT